MRYADRMRGWFVTMGMIGEVNDCMLLADGGFEEGSVMLALLVKRECSLLWQ